MIENVSAVACDVKINEAVRVIICCGDAHRVALTFHSGACGHILKRSISLLMIETIPEFRVALIRVSTLRHRVIEPRAVGEEEIEPPVVVIIEDADATAH